MAGTVIRRRCVIGRDVRVVDESAADVYIESTLRLRPGGAIDLCGDRVRAATVASWAVARLGKEGTVYRGVCRWLDLDG